jgi:uncharacterized membrane protein YgdD (TMEM256/DUF423 family)
MIQVARLWPVLGAAFGGLAVIFGAFGAHALRERLDARAMEIYHTAVQYQSIHALVLLIVPVMIANGMIASRMGTISCALFTGGVIIFSGSLYILALSGVRWLGAITPIGGTLFILGWAILLVGLLRNSQ